MARFGSLGTTGQLDTARVLIQESVLTNKEKDPLGSFSFILPELLLLTSLLKLLRMQGGQTKSREWGECPASGFLFG